MTQINLSTNRKEKKNTYIENRLVVVKGEGKQRRDGLGIWDWQMWSIILLYMCLVAQSCLTICDLVNCSPSGSSVHGILQARILEWVAISFSRKSSLSRDQTHVSCIAGGLFILWAIRDIEWVNNEVLFYSTGTYIKYSATHH